MAQTAQRHYVYHCCSQHDYSSKDGMALEVDLCLADAYRTFVVDQVDAVGRYRYAGVVHQPLQRPSVAVAAVHYIPFAGMPTEQTAEIAVVDRTAENVEAFAVAVVESSHTPDMRIRLLAVAAAWSEECPGVATAELGLPVSRRE